MLLLANIFGGVFMYLYRTIGHKNDISDHTLAWAASTSAIVAVFSRITFGYLYDRFGFKILFNILMVLNIVNAFSAYHLKSIPSLFFISIQLNFLVIGGIFAIFPAPATQTFGKRYGAQVYSLLMFCDFFASLFDTILNKVLYDKFEVGPEYLFYVGGVASIIAMVVTFFFREKLDVERLDAKGQIKWGKLK
jgi:MFS family permease